VKIDLQSSEAGDVQSVPRQPANAIAHQLLRFAADFGYANDYRRYFCGICSAEWRKTALLFEKLLPNK
jgi:hypothetical protein